MSKVFSYIIKNPLISGLAIGMTVGAAKFMADVYYEGLHTFTDVIADAVVYAVNNLEIKIDAKKGEPENE